MIWRRRRPISGHIRRIVSLNATLRGSPKYRFEIVPRLWFLSCTSDCRIFQHQSVPDILQTVFQDQGLLHFEFRIEWTNYPSVEYCVQYQETALDFASRLMEHLGLFYWHEHARAGICWSSLTAMRRRAGARPVYAEDRAG